MIKHPNLSRRTLLKRAASSALAVGISIPANAAKVYFPVFNALLFTGMPDLTAQGLSPTRLAYQSDLWPNGANRSVVPSSAAIQAFLQQTAGMGDMLILDIEGTEWPLYGVSSSVELASIAKYQAVGTLVHQMAPAMDVGLYSGVPERDYWRAIAGPTSTSYQQWQAENTGGAPAAQTMNTLYPSLYTFYTDQSGWVQYATANISEARRLAQGRPVIPFLWPQYHDSTSRAYQFIDPTYWQLQLNTLYQLADGVVLWGGLNSKGYLPWNNTAPWWIATQNFLSSMSNVSTVSCSQ
jgi:hypothetical protein